MTLWFKKTRVVFTIKSFPQKLRAAKSKKIETNTPTVVLKLCFPKATVRKGFRETSHHTTTTTKLQLCRKSNIKTNTINGAWMKDDFPFQLGDFKSFGGMHLRQFPSLEPGKKPSYFPLYWLFNRDPYNSLKLLSPCNWIV